MIHVHLIKLSDHVPLCLRPLKLDDLTEHPGLLPDLLSELNALITGHGSRLSEERLTTAIMLSLVDPDDFERIRPSDLPDVLEGIFEVNGLRELTKQVLKLKVAGHEAQGQALQAFDAMAGDQLQ